MKILDHIINEIKNSNKTIILPEICDDRILEAASIVMSKNICNIIFIGDKKDILDSPYDLSKAKVINPKEDLELTNEFINNLYELRKNKGLTKEEAEKLILNDSMYYACMLVKKGLADGIVSGICHSTANTLRPALQIIRKKDEVDLVSSFLLIEMPNDKIGDEGILMFSDAGLVQNPNAEELASIAVSSAHSYEKIMQKEARVAMLSHSTKGSARGELVDKVVTATTLAKEKDSSIMIDGELQLDAAIIPEVAEMKDPNSILKGKANVLVFPNLDAGNIGYKIAERLGNAKAYGPITQGLNIPINDLSRGSTVDDVVGVIAITVFQTIKK